MLWEVMAAGVIQITSPSECRLVYKNLEQAPNTQNLKVCESVSDFTLYITWTLFALEEK